MFNWLRRRRLSAEARKKLLIVAARSEDAILETHVSNLVDLMETLGEEVDFDRGVELYVEMMSLDDTQVGAVTNRLLTRLERLAERGGRDARRFKDVFR